jgi:hypothetical protein
MFDVGCRVEYVGTFTKWLRGQQGTITKASDGGGVWVCWDDGRMYGVDLENVKLIDVPLLGDDEEDCV